MAGYPKTGPVKSSTAMGLDDRKIPSTFTVTADRPGTEPATAGNYAAFWIAPFACRVVSIREMHTTAGSDGGAVTLVVEKLTGTQAPGAGTSLQSANIDLKGTANTVQAPALSATASDLALAAGNRLALKLTGTPTAIAGLVLTVELDAGQFDP